MSTPKSLTKDLKKSKFKKYEVLDQTPSASGEATTRLWKGDVTKSVSGRGVSVRFTEVSVLSQAQAQAQPQPQAGPSRVPRKSHAGLSNPYPNAQARKSVGHSRAALPTVGEDDLDDKVRFYLGTPSAR